MALYLSMSSNSSSLFMPYSENSCWVELWSLSRLRGLWQSRLLRFLSRSVECDYSCLYFSSELDALLWLGSVGPKSLCRGENCNGYCMVALTTFLISAEPRFLLRLCRTSVAGESTAVFWIFGSLIRLFFFLILKRSIESC